VFLQPRGLNKLQERIRHADVMRYNSFVECRVDKRIAAYTAGEPAARHACFTSSSQPRIPETGDTLYADRNHLLAESRLLVCAGTDTSAATIYGLLFYLVHYPRVLVKLTAEVSRPITGCHAHQLIRLTGKHPLNAEANLSRLYNAGLITPRCDSCL
jgi:cytochrome P450